MTMFYYHLLRDVYHLPPPETHQSSCSDVPRFHLYHQPIETLRAVGVDPCREEALFGAGDRIRLPHLANITGEFFRLGEVRMKQKVFASLPPR
jgi:hypothetical protein